MKSPLHHVRLELAREPGHPTGNPGMGYDLVVPLDDEGRLDHEAARAQGVECRVRRFADGQTDAIGRLRHTVGDRWIFDFEPGERDDETGFRFGEERFVQGEYVSVRAPDGEMHTFQVTQLNQL